MFGQSADGIKTGRNDQIGDTYIRFYCMKITIDVEDVDVLRLTKV